MNTRYKRMSIIFLIAANLRFLLFIVIGPWQDEVLKTIVSMDDGSRYHRIAVNLVENRVFSISEIPPYIPHTFTTPIYPLFLSLVYAIFGQKPYIAILVQNIIGSIICVLTLKIGNKLFDEKTAFWAGLLVAFEYSSISLNELLATDTLFAFLFIIHIYLLVKFIISNSNILLVSSAIFLGLSTLCRPVSVYFFTFIAGVFLLHFRRNLREGIFKYSILTLVFLLAIAPWVVRNYIVSGKFLVSSAQERVLHWNLSHFFNDPQTSEKEVPSQQIRRIPNPSHDPSKTRNDNQGVPTEKNSLNAVLSDSKRYADGMIRFFIIIGSSRFPALLGLPSYSIQSEDWDKGLCEAVRIAIHKKSMLEWFIICFSTSFLFFLYSTMFFGIYASISSNKFIEVTLLISIILYFAIAAGPFARTDRYRVPIMPYIILLSSYGTMQIKKIFEEYKIRSEDNF